jgi:hypothetical protein
MASQRRAKVLANYQPTGQNPPVAERRYAKLNAEGVYSLLESAGKMHVHRASGFVISARALLERMSEGAWQCRATAHEGGHPNDPHADPYLHFNIRIVAEKRTYHVRCHENGLGQVVVFQVTYEEA